MLIEIASADNIQCLEAGEKTQRERERERERERLKKHRLAITLAHSRKKGTRVQINLRYK